jgi:hypothetical protein
MKRLLDKLACWWLDLDEKPDPSLIQLKKQLEGMAEDAYNADESLSSVSVFVTDFGTYRLKVQRDII